MFILMSVSFYCEESTLESIFIADSVNGIIPIAVLNYYDSYDCRIPLPVTLLLPWSDTMFLYAPKLWLADSIDELSYATFSRISFMINPLLISPYSGFCSGVLLVILLS